MTTDAPPRLAVDFGQLNFYVHGRKLDLSTQEWKALIRLHHSPADFVSWRALYLAIYDDPMGEGSGEAEASCVRMVIARLRRKIRAAGEDPDCFLQTQDRFARRRWGSGYRLSSEVEYVSGEDVL